MEIVAQDGSGTAVLSDVSSMSQVTRGEPVFDWSNTDFRVRETLRTANVEPDGEMSIGTNEKPYSTGYFNQIYIGGNPVSVIEEEGTRGIWYYRKWSSGTAECWGEVTVRASITDAIGSMYMKVTDYFSWPDALFSEAPKIVHATPITTAPLLPIIRGGDTTKNQFRMYLLYPDIYEDTIDWVIGVEAKGRWK